jgi:hypothetical protein
MEDLDICFTPKASPLSGGSGKHMPMIDMNTIFGMLLAIALGWRRGGRVEVNGCLSPRTYSTSAIDTAIL